MNEGKEFKKVPQEKIASEKGDLKKKEAELSDDDLKKVSGGCIFDYSVDMRRVTPNNSPKFTPHNKKHK